MFSVVLALASASVAEQMAPARQGMLACHVPDVLFRTCFALSKVIPTGPGTYRFETALLVDPSGPVVMKLHSPATTQGSRICERISFTRLASAKFTIAGKELPPSKRAAIMIKVRRLYAPVNGKMICTEVIPNEGEMVEVIGWVDGKRWKAADYPMKWVDPQDDWIVAR
jgi:hypothetical protein